MPEASTHSPFPFGSGVRGGGDPGRGWQLASQRRCCCEKQRHCLQASVCRLLAGSCLQAPRSHSVAVYEVVGIRAEAGSFDPNEGVAAQGSVSLVVFRATSCLQVRACSLVLAASCLQAHACSLVLAAWCLQARVCKLVLAASCLQACTLLAGSCLQPRVCRLLEASCLRAPRSRSVAVYGVVGIRVEAGSLHPSEGVAARGSVIDCRLVFAGSLQARVYGLPVPIR